MFQDYPINLKEKKIYTEDLMKSDAEKRGCFRDHLPRCLPLRRRTQQLDGAVRQASDNGVKVHMLDQFLCSQALP